MIKPESEANKSAATPPVGSGTVLGCCPSCNFDDAAYKEHQKAAPYYAGKREQYMPHLYKDRFLNQWVVECQNCGFDALFHCDTEKETADAWNAMPRKQPNASNSATGDRGASPANADGKA